jgi:hypothetical protein
MSTYYNGDILSRVDAIDDNDPSPMRRVIYSAQIARVLKKALKSDGLKAQEAAAQKAGA